MAIVFAQTKSALDAHVAGFTPLMLGYVNELHADDVTISADTEDPLKPIANVAEDRTDRRYNATTQTAVITVSWVAPKQLMAIQLSGHNLAVGSTITIETRPTAVAPYVDWFAPIITDGPWCVARGDITPIASQSVRITVNGSDAPDVFELMHLFIGMVLEPPAPIQAPWISPRDARMAVLRHDRSNTGQYLGSAIEFYDAGISVTISPLAQEWAEANWRTLKEYAEIRPIIMIYGGEIAATDPFECAFLHSLKFGSSSLDQPGNMSVTFSAVAISQ